MRVTIQSRQPVRASAPEKLFDTFYKPLNSDRNRHQLRRGSAVGAPADDDPGGAQQQPRPGDVAEEVLVERPSLK